MMELILLSTSAISVIAIVACIRNISLRNENNMLKKAIQRKVAQLNEMRIEIEHNKRLYSILINSRKEIEKNSQPSGAPVQNVGRVARSSSSVNTTSTPYTSDPTPYTHTYDPSYCCSSSSSDCGGGCD